MENIHTLGKVEVKAGELITFTYDDVSPDQRRKITVVALSDLNLSDEMATFYQSIDRRTDAVFTQNALPAFIEHLCERRLLHTGAEVSVHFGTVGRPAARLAAEHKFKINPESFWEEKLLHHYRSMSFSVYNHQDHMLTVMADVDSPFAILADIITMTGEHLGVIHLSVLPDKKHTLISDEDLEVIRSGLQADISLHIEEVSVLVDRVTLLTNPDYGVNPFLKYLSKPKPAVEEKKHKESSR